MGIFILCQFLGSRFPSLCNALDDRCLENPLSLNALLVYLIISVTFSFFISSFPKKISQFNEKSFNLSLVCFETFFLAFSQVSD